MRTNGAHVFSLSLSFWFSLALSLPLLSLGCGGASDGSSEDDAATSDTQSGSLEGGDETFGDRGGAIGCPTGQPKSGDPCTGTKSCDYGTVSCCTEGSIFTGPLYGCSCTSSGWSCFATDYCWGVPPFCTDAGSDGGETRDAGDAGDASDAPETRD
jgi:hypothetical protein